MEHDLRVLEFQISPKKMTKPLIGEEVNPVPESKMSGYEGDSASGNDDSDAGHVFANGAIT